MNRLKLVFVDSGVDRSHPVLKNDSFDEIELLHSSNTDEVRQSGHGTAVYGILRSVRNDYDILSIKLNGVENGVSCAELCEVMEYIEKNVDAALINLSLGATIFEEKEKLESICNRIANKGTVIVAAFDNGGAISYPAAYKSVIGVTSSSFCQYIDEYEIYEDNIVNIAGKGGVQRLLWNSPTLLFMGGNSFACAHISVIVAGIIKEGYIGIDRVLEELQNRAKRIVKLGKDGKVPQINFHLRRVAIYPFNKEMHALFKYYYLLNFNIVAVYDTKYTARVGANTSYLLKDDNALSLEIRNIDSIAWEEFDTIIIGHSDAMENMIGRPSYSEWLINEAYKHKKNIYAFDEFSYCENSANLFIPKISVENIPCSRKGMLYRISTPVLAVCGTSSKQGKFTLQLELRKRFCEMGYKVGQIGTEPNSLLFGMDYIFPMGYNGTVHLTGEESIQYLNSCLNNLEDRDIILVGSQSGTLNYDVSNLSQYCLLQHAFLLGIQPDASILCINPFDDIEYIERTIKYLESAIESRVLALALFPMDISDSWKGIYGSRKEISLDKLKTLKSTMVSQIGLPLYCLGDEGDMSQLFNDILNYFSEE